MKFVKKLWHEFWYKCYHLPKSVQGGKIEGDKLVFKDEKRHKHHFNRAWHHGMEYQKLDPVGMREYAVKSVMKGFKISEQEARKMFKD